MTPAANMGRSFRLTAEAERSVLGGIMLDNKALDEAAALGLVPSDFGLDSHRRIFGAMQRIVAAGGTLDLITVAEELDRCRELNTVGSHPYVSSLLDGVPDRPSIKQHIKIVLEHAAQRRVIAACTAAVAAVEDGSASSNDAIHQVGDALLQILTGSEGAPAERVVVFTDEICREWELLADGAGDLVGLTTSLDALDLVTTGIRRGELWMLSGRTGDGKTALALQIAAANCRSGVPVGFLTIEMSKGDLLQRLWSQESGVPFKNIRHPRGLPPEMRKRILRAATDVGVWPLFVVEDGNLSIQRLTAKARLMIRQNGIRLLVIDYVQLVAASAARDERERLTKISNSLRILAKETGVPILAISQLSRPRDGNPNIRPNRFSMKESGSLENDAHVVVLTYRPVDMFGIPTGEDELIVAKQRHGPVSNERVFFDPSTLTFRERHYDGRCFAENEFLGNTKGY